MINFPSSLDNFTNPTGTDLLENSNAALDHDVQHSNANDAIEALQAKVGADSSAVTTSHDYKLSEVTSTDKAVGKTATQTLTNKTLTSPVVNVGSDAAGDMYYRNGSGAFTRLPIGTANYALTSNGTAPEWVSASTVTADEKNALAGTSGTPSSSNKYVTNDDTAAAATANKLARRNATGDITVPTTPTNSTDAASKSYVDAATTIYKNGTTTYDLSTASGTQTIAHGLGKTPKKIRFTYFKSTSNYNTGAGVYPILYNGESTYNGTTHSNHYIGSDSSSTNTNYLTTYQSTTTDIVYTAGGGAISTLQSAVASLDATNITLTWTKTGSPTGTLLIMWEAEG